MHRWTRATRRVVTQLLVATAALLALPALAAAEGGMPPVGLELKAVDPGSRTVSAVLHCVPPEKAGKTVTLGVAEGVDMSGFAPGQMIGAKINTAMAPPSIVEIGPPPCNPAPQGERPPGGKPGQPGQPGGPGQPGEGGEQGGDDGEEGGRDFRPAFLSRVWKFTAEVDGLEGNKLSITIGKVLNLPQRFRDQDDELVDEDAIVLVKGARVIDEDGERASRADLADAEDVKIHGKLLPEDRWDEDEDGEPVPTIRAKKIYITG